MENINYLECEIDKIKMTIENHFEFLLDEHQVKMESLRMKLEQIGKFFENKLKEGQDKILSDIYTELEIAKENEIISDEKRDQVELLVKELKEKINKISTVRVNIAFYDNESFEIDDNLNGTIHCSLNTRRIFYARTVKCNYVVTPDCPREIIKLAENQYAVNYYNTGLITVINSNIEFGSRTCFKEILTMTNDDYFVYATTRDRFLKFDHKFELLETKKYPIVLFNFDYIGKICIYKGKLYVCMNNVIAIFTDKFDFIDKINLADVPRIYQIKIINDVACVSCYFSKIGLTTCFFTLPEFKIIACHSLADPVIATCNDYFWLYNDQYIACFDTKGEPVIMRRLEIGIPLSMVKAENSLLICLKNDKRIAKITI